MRKDIAPEQFNYNKYPGPEFITFDQFVKSDGILLTILENHKNAFDPTVFGQKFSEILLKYDYIVGDWGNEQLRLKGFYKDGNSSNQQTAEQIDIYLKEYCNFGCAYFILENLDPRELPKEEETQGRRRRRRRSGSKPSASGREKVAVDKTEKPQKRTEKGQKSSPKDKKELPQVRQRTKRKERRQPAEKGNNQQGSKTHFVIRKKEN